MADKFTSFPAISDSPALDAFTITPSETDLAVIPRALLIGGTASIQHPQDSNSGQGRTASLIAWSLMSLVRAVPPRPMGITRVRTEGANAVIEFGPVNA